jgi:SAM-dependent methyltransferase
VASAYYATSFYEQLRAGVSRSADIIVPLVLELLPVRSVVDIGCGDGGWLASFQKRGVEDVLGLDGDYVDRKILQIPKECFQACDLTTPLKLGRTFDLAVSLEVAEHLPATCQATFVESLTRLAPVVLFSAAIPLQGGTHHVNEQWPDIWANLFRVHDFYPVDAIRKRVWANDRVDWWYAQNALLFVHSSVLEGNAALKAEFEQTNPSQLRLVHPRNYLEVVMPARPVVSGLREALQILFVCSKNALRKRLYAFTKVKDARS